MTTTTKRNAMLARIERHAEGLALIYPHATKRGYDLCAALRRIETMAHRLTEAICNGMDEADEAAADAKLEALRAKAARLLGAGDELFVNRDPRGYALKLDDAWTAAHADHLHRDWGGYGIVAPDLSLS